MTLMLTEADIRRCLDYPTLVPLMGEALAAFSRGTVVQPVRTNLRIEPAGGFYGVMPAHLSGTDGGVFGLKSVSFFPGNAAFGLPTHLATILLLRGSTGALDAILDARLITEMRTAAVSALSLQLMADPEARHLAILGSGVQARSHLEAIAAVRPPAAVRLWSRTAASAERFAAAMAPSVAVPIEVCADARTAVRGADLVVTATSASEPVLSASWLAPHAHLMVVGSSDPMRREVDTATIVGSRVIVDSRDAAAVEAGDLLIPATEGAWTLDRIAGELGDVAAGEIPGREHPGQRTLFKSLGLGVEDVATAALVVARARAAGLGSEVAV